MKVISGGQTGADQAGLIAAKELGIETGGWMPKNCMTDEGPRPDMLDFYGMKECEQIGYPARTELNVRDSDGTVVFGDPTSAGSKLTVKLCRLHKKPFTGFPFAGSYPGTEEFEAAQLKAWVQLLNIKTLNVAGNRERTNPGIFEATKTILLMALKKE